MLSLKRYMNLFVKVLIEKINFDEFETLFGQSKNDTTEDTVNIKKVKQKDNDGDIKRFAANFYKASNCKL